MNSEILLQSILVIVMTALSGFFSSAETAMTTVNRIRIRALAESGDKRALTLEKIISDSGKMLSTILIGNNIVNMAASALMTTLTIQVLGNFYVGFATGLLTLVILIFGEITPKTLASIHSEKLALSYARIIWLLMKLLSPIVFLTGRLSSGVMFLLRTDPEAKNSAMTEHELRTLVNESQKEGVIEREEKQMIYNVFDFGDSYAKDVMIPRIDMAFVNVNATYEELLEIFRKNMHTRYPVYEENTDNVIGIINMKDLLLYPTEEAFSIRTILRDAFFTYEYKKTTDLLKEMRKASISLAIILDEYGATAGLVTLENLLEEIVGEIRDEYDADEEDDIREIKKGVEYLVLGSAKLDDINEMLGLHLESEDYDSIGGYIIGQLDSLPSESQSVELADGTRLVVDKIDKNRIERVHLYLPPLPARS